MRYLYLFISVFFSLVSSAQIDTSFWFVAPEVPPALTNNPVELRICSYTQPTTVRVRQPANAGGVNLTFTLAANTCTTVNMTASITAIINTPANTITDKGLYISSTENVSAYYVVGSGNNKEMASLKGSRAVGYDFFTPFPTDLPTLVTGPIVGDVAFDIVATESGITTVLITPKANCIGRAKNVTFAINLNQGETFSMKDLGTVSPTEMAGSIVSADKKIAVTISGAVGNSTVCPSFYTDQITNTSNLGTEFVVHNTGSSPDKAYILSPVNGCSLTVTTSTGTAFWLINSGETFTLSNSGADFSHIKTDKPVYVLQTAGFGCNMSAAQVAPAYCAGSYTTSFTRVSTDSMFVNIFTRAGFQNTFTLTVNSVPVPVLASSFTVVPGSSNNLVGARLFFTNAQIPVNAHCKLENANDIFGCIVNNGSTLGGAASAFVTEFGQTSFVKANVVPNATICANTTFTLNGVIGGGPIAGNWSTNGFGSFSGGPSQLTNNVYTPSQLDTVNKPIKIVLSSTGICPNLSDTLKLTVLQQPIVNAGVNQLKCTNNATINLNGTVIGASSQGTWSAVAPASGTFVSTTTLNTTYYPSSLDTSQTQIKIVLTSINNGICNAETDTISINFQKAPIVRASSTPTLIRCSNNSTVNLSGYISNIVSGIWSSSGSGVFVPNNISLTNNYLPSLNDLNNGSVWLKLTTPPSALCNDVSDSVLVVFTDPSSISAGIDLNSCKNNPIIGLNAIITGTSSSTAVWSGGTGTFVPNNAALNATYVATPAETSAGFVLLTVTTTSNGICNGSTDQIRIDFRDKPTANFAATTVCLNQATQYTDNSVNTSGLGALNSWKWYFGNGDSSITVNPAITFTAAGDYTTQLIVGNTFNCFDSISRVVTVYPLPIVNFGKSRSCTGSSQLICFSDSTTIDAPSSIPSTGYYWDFGGNGFSISKDTCFVFPTEGKYSITHQVTSNNGCVATQIQTLNITPKPKAKFLFINSSTQSLGSNIEFVDSSKNSVGWIWDFGNGGTSILQNPTAFYGSNGNYTVTQTVSDQFGCTDTYTAVVRVLNIVNEITELIPNIITPNNDGKNDFWRLDFIDVYYPNAEIEIFNRWGESIFKSVGYSNAWDGTYKGDPLPVGAYYYIIDLKDQSKPEIIKGNITLLK
ncbi:MAG: gliding motility-associated C-terminal domain-containing protein [Bacteroidia bacterium]